MARAVPLTPQAQREGATAALSQLCAAALAAWSRDAAEAHAWAARALVDRLGPPAETAARHLGHGRQAEARTALRRLLAEDAGA